MVVAAKGGWLGLVSIRLQLWSPDVPAVRPCALGNVLAFACLPACLARQPPWPATNAPLTLLPSTAKNPVNS